MTTSTRVAGSLFLVLALAAGTTACATFEGARLYRRGTGALDRGDPEQAVTLLERAAQRVPNASEIQNHLGLAYAAAGRDAEARAAFERAVDLDCSNQAAASNLRVAVGREDGGRP